MKAVLERREYRSALRAVGNEQELMIGYSDLAIRALPSNSMAGHLKMTEQGEVATSSRRSLLWRR